MKTYEELKAMTTEDLVRYAMEEKTIYMVTGFQLIYGSGVRDNVKLNEPEFTEDIEGYRRSVTEKHGCMSVNLTYVEIGKGKFSNF